MELATGGGRPWTLRRRQSVSAVSNRNRNSPYAAEELKPSSGLEPDTSLPSSDEAGAAGKAGKPRARKPRKKRNRQQTSDRGRTQAPAFVFEKLRWLLGKAVRPFGHRRISRLRPDEIAGWRMTIPAGHRFEATQALRQVPARASTGG
jgi:hypothetical protein